MTNLTETAKTKGRLAWVAHVPTWGSFIVVLIGGAIGLFEYFEYKSEQRILRSMDFVKELQSEQIVDDLVSLDKAIMKSWPKMRLQLIGVEDDKAQEIFSQSMAAFVVDAGIEGSALRTAVLMDSFAVCMDRGLCDCETGIAFFGATVAHTWPMIGPYVDAVSQRGREVGFGRSFEKLSQSLNSGADPCV